MTYLQHNPLTLMIVFGRSKLFCSKKKQGKCNLNIKMIYLI